MKIEVIYGHTPTDIFIWKNNYSLPEGKVLTVKQVISDSHVVEIYHLDLVKLSVAIFNDTVNLDHQLQDGDRITILRPLQRVRERKVNR